MPILINHQHELFCREIIAGRTIGDAAEMCGMRREYGPKLRKQPDIEDRIAELRDEDERARKYAVALASQKTGINKAWVIEKLRQNVERAMQAQAVLDPQTGEPTGLYVYEGAVANKALELIGKELGMFVQKVVVDDRRDFSAMSDDELQEFVERRSRELGLAAIDITPRGIAGPKPH